MRRIGRARHRQIAEEVVIVTELQLLSGGGLLHRVEHRRCGQYRIAPADQDVGIVARGDMMRLVDAGGDFLEAVAGAVLSLRPSGGGDGKRAHGRRDRSHAERALEKVAAMETGRNDVSDGRIVGRIASCILGFLEGLCAGQGRVDHGFAWASC